MPDKTPDVLTISLLGSPRIAQNGRSLHFPSVKANALLAYLSVSGMLHDRAELAALLWPESDNKRARGALRYTLSIIKKELGDGYLIINRRQIGMNPQADWEADVVTLRRLLGPALGPGDELMNGAFRNVEKGVDLYRADFLQGFTLRDSEGFNEWAFIQGEALRRDLATALKRLAAYHQEQQHWDTAVTYAHQWLNLDPLHEPAHCQLMQLYAELEEWTAVHNQYQSLTDLLEKELGVPPQPETSALYQQLCLMRETAVSAPIPLADLSPDQRGRRVLMEKVRRFWVDGLLAPLRDEKTFINLKLQFANEAIDHPWADVLEARHNPDAANIYHAFRNANRSLLILGAPGAGKSISLVELTNYLLAIAGDDESQPIPVVLNLSGWAGKQMGIGEWAVEEMIAKYQIPRRMGRNWLAEDRLMFMLDGLDEMPADDRTGCISAINEYRQTHGLADVVVCCRQGAYETAVRDQDTRLQLNGAVMIRPLTTAQIRQHAPPSLVRAIFQDEALLEIAQSPLNLNMLQTAFNGSNGTHQETVTFTRSNLFDQYVRRMFQRQEAKGDTVFDRAEISGQLIWLAQQMRRHNQSIFLIEQLQPSWLENGRARWLYLLLTRTAMAALLGTLVIWSFVQLIRINPPYIEVNFLGQFAGRFGITAAPWDTLFALFSLNLLVGLVVALLDGLFFAWRQRHGDGTRRDRRLGWVHLLVVGTVAWAIIAIPIALTDAPLLAIFLGGLAAAGFVLSFRYAGGRQSWRTEVRMHGALKWSWRNAAVWGMVGVALSLLWSGFIWLQEPTAVAWQLNSFTNGLMLFLFGGVTGKQPVLQSRPNGGMRIAAKNGLKAAVIVAVPLAVTTAVAINIPTGMYTGLMLGLFAGSIYGFNDVIKHLIVRLLLWRTRHTPLNYVRFLDCAADCVLLQKVGGSYTFRHRLLQDHFADK